MLNERKLTKAELNKREDVIKDMKKNKRALVKKYGKDAESVMYGRATNIAKKQAESMNQDKLREMIKDSLQNPKKADLNKDGKLSDYEKKRGAAIEKNMKKVDEMDINGPVMMKMRAAKMKADKFAGSDPKAGSIIKSRGFDWDKNTIKIDKLKKKRAQIMSDMEQEAEPEGGPIADRYGDMLNKIDAAIAMLQGQGKGDEYMSKDEIERRAAMIKEMSGDKMEAAWELQEIMDQLYQLSDRAKMIFRDSFPSEYSRLDAYGALDFGTSSNRYDVTFEKALENLDMEDDDEEVMQEGITKELSDAIDSWTDDEKVRKAAKAFAAYKLHKKGPDPLKDLDDETYHKALDAYRDAKNIDEDLDLGHQDNEPHMLKGDLYRIGKYAMELYQMVDQFEYKGEVDFPHWWQSKVIKAKDALVGAKHYLDFEIKEPQIDAMVDVAQDVEAIDEAVGKFVVRPCSNPGTPFAVWQTSKDGENDKRIKGFKTKEDAKKFADEKNSVNEEAPGEADMVASDIQKAMNAAKGDEAKTHQLKKARTAMNKGDLDKAKKIADRIAKMLKNK